jgi:hypothetical protein
MPGLARRVRVVFDWTVDLLFPASALQLGLASRGRCIEARPLGAVERLAIELPCMNNPEDEPAPAEETDADRRRGILADKGLSLDLVSALAGDRPLTEAEENHLGDLERDRGPRFFSDVFYAITHHFFPPEIAKDLWTEVVRHKVVLSETLGRNVRIAVAALDYLSNITDNLGLHHSGQRGVCRGSGRAVVTRRFDGAVQPHVLLSTDRPGSETLRPLRRGRLPGVGRHR